DRQGLGEDAAAAADVDRIQPAHRAAAMPLDPAEAQRVDLVQGLELAGGIPPARGERLELGELLGVYVGLHHGSLPPRPAEARSRRALPITLTDDSAMASAATCGDSSRPKAG